MRRLPLPIAHSPQVVGVDDWALRRGQIYGTIVVDLERRRVVDLLPDRQAETLSNWLRAQPAIEVVARDRSSEYARGITMAAPRAVQVADRWHLLHNVRQMLQRWLHGAHAQLRRLPMVPGAETVPTAARTRAYRRTAAERAVSADSRARWLAVLRGGAPPPQPRRIAAGHRSGDGSGAFDGSQVRLRVGLPRTRPAPTRPDQPAAAFGVPRNAAVARLRERSGAVA